MVILIALTVLATVSDSVGACRERLRGSRAAMHDGNLIVHVEYRHVPSGSSIERDYRLYFLDDNVRVDVERDNGPKTALFRQVDMVADGEHIMYTTIRSGSGAAVVSTIKSATEMPESVERLISHPRSIGLVATPFESIAGYQPDQMIGGAGRVDETIVIEQGEYDGIPCDIWVRRGPNYEVRGWISRGEGAPVLKVETRGVSESMVQTRTIETKYENRAGVTIPVSYEFACVNNGVVVETEKGTVEYVSLNSGLERNVFDLSGIGVAEGTVFAVYRRDQSGDFVWDGAKLVPREVPTFNQPTPLVPRSRGQSWIVLFAVNSALFAAFAVFFGARWMRGQK